MVVVSLRTAYKRIAGHNHRPQISCIEFAIICFVVIPVLVIFGIYLLHFYDEREIDIDAVDDYVSKNWHVRRKIEDEKSRKLVCYYNIPDPTNPLPLLPKDLNCDLCTHINVGFATVHNNTILLNDILSETIVNVVSLKKCNPKLKVLLSIGGAFSGSGFSDMVQNHTTRKIFIGSVRDNLKLFKLDGIDLDWEFPAIEHNLNGPPLKKNRQRQHFSQLLREIRMEYYREKRDYLLTVAVAAIDTIIDAAYDVSEINLYVDFVNLMTYDFHFYSKITPMTGFNSPLFKRGDEIGYLSTLNINNSIFYWLDKGLERNKLVVGLPTYGHSFNLVNANNGFPGSPANGNGRVGNFGFVDYSDVCTFIENNKSVVVTFDNETVSPYLHLDSEWISYDDERSLMDKAKYIRELDLGGIMVYSLNSDDFSGLCSNGTDTKFFLTRSINKTLYDKL